MPDGYDSAMISALRAKKNRVDPFVPYHYLHEKEPGLSGGIESVNTIFLTSKECAFKCLMCDLWKNTLDIPLPEGAILQQIDYALERLPEADVVKLYNNGNFFDTKAISPNDYPAIARRLAGYKKVIVENHPKLCNNSCIEFLSLLDGRLEIAMGLESIHPDVLPRLNKQITPEDFEAAAGFLRRHDIDVRAFILLNPPYLTEKKSSIEWTLKTVRFAFESGTARCAIIPVRRGNGVMEVLQQEKCYEPPTLSMLEEVVDKAMALQQGQVFADTWDIGFLSECPACFEQRKARLENMNLCQHILHHIDCTCSAYVA
jgi:radical SAM enzyme (TIGR01210 family)